MIKKTLGVLAIAASAASYANADLSELSASATLAYESEYIFRGVELGDESFQPSIEFSLPVGEGDLYASVWYSDDFKNKTGNNNELDYILGYSFAATEEISLDVGYTYYSYPGAGGRENEYYLGASFDVVLSPAVYVYYNDTYEALIVEGSVGYSIEVEENTSLELGAHLGWVDASDANTDQAGGSPDNGYTYYGINADVVYTLNEVASVSLGVRFAGNNDNAGPEENFWWGASASFGF